MRNKMIGSICALAISAVMLDQNLAGAQETDASPQAKLANSAKDIRLETIRTRDQLQASVDALDALTKQKTGNLQPTYDAFSEEVKKTHEAAKQTVARAGSMETASKDYFGAWQTEIAGIANASLRNKAQKRLDDVRKNYDKVVGSLRQAAVQFKPFLSNLDDVQKTLANDVTAGGVKAIRGVANEATGNEKKVLRSVNDAIDQLASMQKALSSQKGP